MIVEITFRSIARRFWRAHGHALRRTAALLDVGQVREVLARTSGSGRLSSAGLVVAFHLLFLGVLALGLRLPTAPPAARELQVRLLPDTQLERPPPLPDVALPIIEPPQFVIADKDSGSAVAALPAAAVLAPRSDPAHPNEALPFSGSAGPTIVLKLFVLADGAIGDAQVAVTSGDPSVDSNALAFVRRHWRFLPAMVADKAIAYWTTVAVALRK